MTVNESGRSQLTAIFLSVRFKITAAVQAAKTNHRETLRLSISLLTNNSSLAIYYSYSLQHLQ